MSFAICYTYYFKILESKPLYYTFSLSCNYILGLDCLLERLYIPISMSPKVTECWFQHILVNLVFDNLLTKNDVSLLLIFKFSFN